MKLGRYYLRRGAMLAAVRQIREADAICQLHGIVQREDIAGSLGAHTLALLRRFWPKYHQLKAIETPIGYQFIEV